MFRITHHDQLGHYLEDVFKVCTYNTLFKFITFVFYVFRLMHQLGHYLEILRFVHCSTLQL